MTPAAQHLQRIRSIYLRDGDYIKIGFLDSNNSWYGNTEILREKCASHPAQQRIEQVLNTLIARFMLANEKGQGRPWNIGHIQSLIEEFRDKEAIALLKAEVPHDP